MVSKEYLLVIEGHRIKDDRMEKCKNGRRVVHCTFTARLLQVYLRRKDCVSIKLGGFISRDLSSEH